MKAILKSGYEKLFCYISY